MAFGRMDAPEATYVVSVQDVVVASLTRYHFRTSSSISIETFEVSR